MDFEILFGDVKINHISLSVKAGIRPDQKDRQYNNEQNATAYAP
jgi:hypothetical protein